MKQSAFHLILFGIIILSLNSCQQRFANTLYQGERTNDQTIAVLPYTVITTGRIPQKVTEEMIWEIEESESLAFQTSLYHQIIHRYSTRPYEHLDIRVQEYGETNKRLMEAGYTLRETWDIPSTELAEILGVDAVVRSKVHKNQYLTNLESFGVFVAQTVIQDFWLPVDDRTSDVRISTSIINTEDGTVQWSASRICPTDWNLNTYDVIERINFRISKQLPR